MALIGNGIQNAPPCCLLSPPDLPRSVISLDLQMSAVEHREILQVAQGRASMYTQVGRLYPSQCYQISLV